MPMFLLASYPLSQPSLELCVDDSVLTNRVSGQLGDNEWTWNWGPPRTVRQKERLLVFPGVAATSE